MPLSCRDARGRRTFDFRLDFRLRSVDHGCCRASPHRRRPVRAAGNETVELLKRVAALLARGVIYAVITLAFLIPLIWMLFGSVRRETEIFGMLYPFGWHTFFPVEWTLEHFRDILGMSEAGQRAGLNFGRNLMNSFIVSTGVVVSSLVFNTMGAYFFARLKIPPEELAARLRPGHALRAVEVTMVLYIVVRYLNLHDYWAMIVPLFASR